MYSQLKILHKTVVENCRRCPPYSVTSACPTRTTCAPASTASPVTSAACPTPSLETTATRTTSPAPSLSTKRWLSRYGRHGFYHALMSLWRDLCVILYVCYAKNRNVQIRSIVCGLGCVTRALVRAWFTQPSPRIFLHFCRLKVLKHHG